MPKTILTYILSIFLLLLPSCTRTKKAPPSRIESSLVPYLQDFKSLFPGEWIFEKRFKEDSVVLRGGKIRVKNVSGESMTQLAMKMIGIFSKDPGEFSLEVKVSDTSNGERLYEIQHRLNKVEVYESGLKFYVNPESQEIVKVVNQFKPVKNYQDKIKVSSAEALKKLKKNLNKKFDPKFDKEVIYRPVTGQIEKAWLYRDSSSSGAEHLWLVSASSGDTLLSK